MFNICILGIIDLEIEIITMNSRLRLTGNNINLFILDKFMFENFDKMQQISTLFLLSLFKIVFEVKDYCTI